MTNRSDAEQAVDQDAAKRMAMESYDDIVDWAKKEGCYTMAVAYLNVARSESWATRMGAVLHLIDSVHRVTTRRIQAITAEMSKLIGKDADLSKLKAAMAAIEERTRREKETFQTHLMRTMKCVAAIEAASGARENTQTIEAKKQEA